MKFISTITKTHLTIKRLYDEVEHVSKQRLENLMLGGMAPAVII